MRVFITQKSQCLTGASIMLKKSISSDMEDNKYFPSWNITFEMEANEETKAFFKRMDEEQKERDKAIRERIKQLFDEYVKIDGEEKDSAYWQCVNLFGVGYQLGWNDCHKFAEDIIDKLKE